MGITREQLEALHDYERSDAFTVQEKALLRFADAMTSTPAEVSDEVFADVAEAFTDDQVIELAAWLAWENFRARFNHAFGVESDGFSEGAFCPLPTP